MYIVIEGQDATGKDAQAERLVKYLTGQGKKVVHYAESGTGSKDEFVREIARLNYGSKQEIDHRTRVMLFLVNRYEQWRKLAMPALERGEIVITTRNWFSTLIYEGYAGGVSRSLIVKLHKLVMPERYFRPDKIVIMTLSEEEREKRLRTQRREGEVLKSQPVEFQQKINQGYLKVAKEYEAPTLDARGGLEEVEEKLRKLFGL